MNDSVARARADIQEFGWHLVMVTSEGRPGFAYTIGLWESYQHPEVIVFAPSEDPTGMARRLAEVAKIIAGGQTLESGQVYEGLFGAHAGAVHDVQSRWHLSFLGTAAAVYGHFDFPVVQLFWPDGQGLFPWQSGFVPQLFAYQPVLSESNPILANVGSDVVQQLVDEEGTPFLERAIEELFLPQGDLGQGDLIEAWRWRVGPEAELFRVTFFGDLFLKTPDGHIHWLDTGSDVYEEIASDTAGWVYMLCDNPSIFFHASTLLHFRALDYAPKEGQVFSWIQPPLLGGEDTVDNFNVVSPVVHLTHSGRTAQASQGSE